MLYPGDVLKFKKDAGSIRAGMKGTVLREYRGKWLVMLPHVDAPYAFKIERLRQLCIRLKKKK